MIANFQASSREQGEAFERDCVLALKTHGFEVLYRKLKMKTIGIEIDIAVQNYHGVSMWFECKGSLQGGRPGAKRTDTLKKAIGDAYLFTRSDEYSCSTPLQIFASHVPEKGQGLAMLLTVPRTTVYDVLNPWNDSARLKWLYRATSETLEADIDRQSLCDILTNRWRIHCNGK